MNDDLLWERFAGQRLAAVEWTHEAHVRVAMMHLRRWSLDVAHIRMRAGIIRLNQAHGLVETEARGYHETITRGFLELLAPIVAGAPSEQDSRALLELHRARLGRDALLRHYSRDRLFAHSARAAWVEPDLAPFS